MLVKLSKTIDYYAEINTEGFESNTEALESFRDINVRHGIDSFMKPAPYYHVEARVIFALPKDTPINRFSIKEKTGLLTLDEREVDIVQNNR